MKKLNNRVSYSDEDLKILKKSIQAVRNLNWNKDHKKNNKEKAFIQRKAA